MSSILKALRQLEKEKAEVDGSDSLFDPAEHEPAPARHRRRTPRWLGVGLVVAACSLLAVLLAPRLTGPPAVPEVIRAPEPASEPTRPRPQAPPIGRSVPMASPEQPAAAVQPVAEAEPVEPAGRAEAAALVGASTPPPAAETGETAEPARVAADAAFAVPAESPVREPAERAQAPAPPAKPPAIAASAAPARTPPPVTEAPARRALAGERPPKHMTLGVVLSNQDLRAPRSEAVERAQELVGGSAAGGAEPAVSAVDGPPEPEPLATAEAASAVPEAAVPEAAGSERVPLAPPPLALERTSWHPMSERREATVSIDGTARRLRQGDAVLGYRVVEITPSSVVFGRGAETVGVRVGGR